MLGWLIKFALTIKVAEAVAFYPNSSVQSGSWAIQTYPYTNVGTPPANVTLYATFSFLTEKPTSNYMAVTAFEKLNYAINGTAGTVYWLAQSIFSQSQSSMTLYLVLNYKSNLYRWVIRYLTIPQSIQFVRASTVVAEPSPSIMNPHTTQSFVSALPFPINTTGTCMISYFLTGIKLSQISSTHEIGLSVAYSGHNSTTVTSKVTNQASVAINFLQITASFIIYNTLQSYAAGSPLIVTPLRLSIGLSYSNSQIIRDLTTFLGISGFRFKDQNYFDFNCSVIDHQIIEHSQNINMQILTAEFLAFLGFCPSNCAACFNSSACTACISGNFIFLSNFTCLSSCPLGHYQNLYNWSCVKCSLNCLTCNQSVCFVCSVGFLVIGGCTSFVGCAEIDPALNQSYNCIRCLPNYWMTTRHCTNIIGCLSTSYENNTVFCIGCNIMKRFIFADKLCACQIGFSLNQTEGRCLEICGDGTLFYNECDDGNLVDGDGCSSNCKIELMFKCENGSYDHISDCYFSGIELRLVHSWSNKTKGMDQVQMAFLIEPKKYVKNRLNVIKSVNLVCLAKISNVTWFYQSNSGVLFVKAAYFEDLQNVEVQVIVDLNIRDTNNSHLVLNTSFVSSGSKLYVYNKYFQINQIKTFFQFISYIILTIFFVSNFVHKMIGLQLLHTFQFFYFVCIIDNNQTQPYSIFTYFTYLNLNFKFPINGANNYYISKQSVSYETMNEIFTKRIIGGLIFPVLIIIFGYFLWKALFPTDIHDKLGKNCSKAYKSIMFPLTIAFMLQILAPKPSLVRSGNYSVFVLNFSLLTALAIVYFFEWICLFRKQSNEGATGAKGISYMYIPVYLTYYLFQTLVLILAGFARVTQTSYFLLAISIVFFAWFVNNLPYNHLIHNTGQIINLSLIIIFIVWGLIRNRFEQACTEQQQLFALFVLGLLMIITVLMTVVRLGLEIKSIYSEVRQTTTVKKKAKIQSRFDDSQLRQQMMASIEQRNKIFTNLQNFKTQVLQWQQINKGIEQHPIDYFSKRLKYKNSDKKKSGDAVFKKIRLYQHQSKKIINQ